MKGMLVAVVFAVSVIAAPAAHASGRCLFQGDWDCYGAPQWNGPTLRTWDIPGPINQPVICSPYDYSCAPYASAP